MAATKFYLVWMNMIRRCNNPKCDMYKYYGGRGIKVCKRWLNYEKFEDDMYDEYGYYIEKNPKIFNITFTLDRINNKDNYCKKNCRWATAKEQANNRRKRLVLR